MFLKLAEDGSTASFCNDMFLKCFKNLKCCTEPKKRSVCVRTC